jgi:hypothetical protein
VKQLHPHHQVVEEELGRMGLVGPDPADVRRQVEDEIRPGVGQQAADSVDGNEVVVPLARNKDLVCPARRKCFEDEPAEEAPSPGDADALPFPES